MVKGQALARPSERSEQFEPIVRHGRCLGRTPHALEKDSTANMLFSIERFLRLIALMLLFRYEQDCVAHMSALCLLRRRLGENLYGQHNRLCP